MNSKLIKFFLVSVLFISPIFIFAVTDEVIVQQVVDNSCNENGICEIAKGETIYTCPHDCHRGNINPAILQANAEMPPIEIYGLEISVHNGEVVIAWRTNKPTNSVLILADSRSETIGEYFGELYLLDHSVLIKNLDLSQKHFFKIFAKGPFGDDNYETAELFVIAPWQENLISDDSATSTQDLQILPESGIVARKAEEGEETRYIIVAPFKKEIAVLAETQIQKTVELKGLSKITAPIIVFLEKARLIGENSLSSFVTEYRWLLAILSGILFFSVI